MPENPLPRVAALLCCCDVALLSVAVLCASPTWKQETHCAAAGETKPRHRIYCCGLLPGLDPVQHLLQKHCCNCIACQLTRSRLPSLLCTPRACNSYCTALASHGKPLQHVPLLLLLLLLVARAAAGAAAVADAGGPAPP